jgi:predicted ATPase
MGRLTSLRIPATLIGVLRARMDSLPEWERELLQRASVVGRVFWDEALVRMGREEEGAAPAAVHQALAALQERELIFERAEPAFAGTREYIFKHAIVREVAYDSVLRRERRDYHRRVAEWLLERRSERTREHLGLIADHLEAAGEGARAALYLRRAGEEALALFANAEARAFLDRALALTPEAAVQERYALVAAREKAYGVMGERQAQREDLETLEALAEALGDERRQAEVALRRALYAWEVGELATGVDAVQTAIALAEKVGDAASEALGHLRWGRMLRHHLGDFPGARLHLERSLEIAEAARLEQVKVESLLNLSAVLCETGDLPTSIAYIQRVLPLCRAMADRWLENSAHRHMAYLRKSVGDFAGAKVGFEQTLQFSRMVGYRFWECVDLCNLALVHHRLGDAAAAIEYSEQALRLSEEIRSSRYQGYAWMSLGHALAAQGRIPEATEAFRQARRIRVAAAMAHLAMESIAGLAFVALATGNLHEARGYAEEILAHLERGPLDGTEEPFWIQWVCFQVLQQAGDERAEGFLETSWRHLQEWAGRLPDEALRRSFLAIPAHRELQEAWQRLLEEKEARAEPRPRLTGSQ